MTASRVTSAMQVSALIRRAEGEGGFGAVLTRGDSQAGAIFVILLEKGVNPTILERVLGLSGDYRWEQAGGAEPRNAERMREFLAKRQKIDPDCWIIELDVASAERFAAEMNALD